MNFGFRTPSLKRMIKGRTTARVKRAMKKTINPIYAKKGIGFVTKPKKAVYNKIYKKTSFGLSDLFKLFK
ncbi:MAG: hypothetical protein FD141_757 [Fusobacteria bacterium]|nr:MAG: hypothetical protein FD141_757 [Fusobacteriota bacterium]KAF0228577.1 MAG: hypothetical protein FD182_833 [Fusobacteriota bacterium]